ncbi:unnamed protein product [Brachionus calyciflorus]|uniref:CBM1 domain-containing protein n=1 Tax=Brachionus calyciflorus TaxID=104777 RepID=A0A813NAV9_9BILA|nr:unnamed protein product [Brachionus calyciflorus]
MLKAIFLSLLSVQLISAQVQEWGQCGGASHTGSKECVSGLVCVYVDYWFSQCQKPSGTTNSPPTTTTQNTVVTSGGSGGSSSDPCSHGTFCINGTKILDSNRRPFLIRGINNAHADWDNWSRSWALKSLNKIAEYKTNTVRVQWRMKINNNDLTLSHLENIIVTAKNLGMVSMVQLHDATGDSDPNALKSCAQWFVNHLSLFQKHKQYVMINIANEWSPWGTSGADWKNAYLTAINLIRSAGWQGIIVVDAPAYAQDPNAIIQYGSDIMFHDKTNNKNGNILFSLHTYVQWKKTNGDYQFRNHLTKIVDKGLPVVIGEFADKHPEHPSCQWADIDYLDLMKVCKERDIGYLGWSWAGNGWDCNQSIAALNMIQGDQQVESTWTQGVLSDWGKKIYDTPLYGIKATSVKASIFP